MRGYVDYTMAKRAIVEGYRRGSLDRLDICDAHPELIRAGRNIGIVQARPCPLCATRSLRQVRYVFGDQLKHLSGRPVYPDNWDVELSDKFDEFRCYVVEVCLDCHWNHIAACYLMGRRFQPTKRQAAAGRRTSP